MDEIDGRLVGGLVVLAAVADARSFGKAAERLGMTQSGVSKAIAKLESRLGARLIHRTSRAVELTDEGRALYERVVQHLAGIGEAAAETSKSRDAVRGRLRQCRSAFLARRPVAEAERVPSAELANGASHRNEGPHRGLGERRLRSRGPLRRANTIGAHHPPHSRRPYSYRSFADLHRSARKTRSSARLGERHSPMHPRRRHFNRAPFRLGVPPREGIDFARGQWAA